MLNGSQITTSLLKQQMERDLSALRCFVFNGTYQEIAHVFIKLKRLNNGWRIRKKMHIFAFDKSIHVHLYCDRIIVLLLSITYTFRHCSNCENRLKWTRLHATQWMTDLNSSESKHIILLFPLNGWYLNLLITSKKCINFISLSCYTWRSKSKDLV